MTRNHKRRPKRHIPLSKKKSKMSLVTVKQQKLPIRRYETYHEEFITYDQIKDLLNKLHKSFPSTVQVQVIGKSAQGRPIYMAVISDGSGENPKMGTMVIAGGKGTEWFTISSALFMIDHLVKGRNLLKIMDYYIVPCSNPDAYECSLASRGKEIKAVDLSTNFPFSLGVYDFKGIKEDTFFRAVKVWKDNFVYECPERLALIKAFLRHQVAVKLFISLEGDGTKITYPFNCTPGKLYDSEELEKVAKAGQNGVKGRCFQVGSMYQLNGLRFGSMVDYVRMCQSSIRFAYAIHVNKKEKTLGPGKIMAHGQDVMNCVRFMARNVYMIYNDSGSAINVCDDLF
ncbi:hypothetical protein NQ315_001812 [Exocentrus adspersus]|uniref:Peptidase M14 domain-containing protein n=1 Tax=Exocentrus adspersus TaxID=1586481 RepID=A0AAV8WAI5_9CUCU|nr:hypothetical protein NQ315_001812 [Exocentrus adspersus]